MAIGNWASKFIKIKEGNYNLHDIYNYNNTYRVSLYKNWIYIYKLENKESPIEFWYGYITINDIEIYAERGPQDGIYAVIKFGWGEQDAKILAWIGCYGYNDDEWVGVTKECEEFLTQVIERSHDPFHNRDKGGT